MQFVFDLITLINLIFCIGIVVVSVWWKIKTDSNTPLFLGAAFLLYGISHLSLLLGMKDQLEPALVVIRICAYFLIFVGFIYIARDVMNRREAEKETLQKHEDLNRAYEQLSCDEEELKQNYDELRKAQEALMESEERFRILYDQNPSMYFTLDNRGNVLSVNLFGAGQLGFTPEELTGRPFKNLFHPDEEKQVEDFLNKCLKNSGYPVNSEFRNISRGGDVLHVRETVRTVRNADGSTVFLVVSENITEQKMAQAALKRATVKLNLLNSVTFTDIQNAVFSLHGYLELQNQMPADKEHMDMTKKEIKIVREINEALQFAKKYQDLGLRPPLWQNVEQVFLFAISHLDSTFSNLSRRVNVKGLEIYADPFLEDVFYALAENVIRHGEGATAISLYYDENDENPGDLRIIFEDDGTGIPAENKESIFNRHPDDKPGFGLFLSREILSISGITISETGEPGKGARFEINVPKGAYRFKIQNDPEF